MSELKPGLYENNIVFIPVRFSNFTYISEVRTIIWIETGLFWIKRDWKPTRTQMQNGEKHELRLEFT
jgi:hypothetical protein